MPGCCQLDDPISLQRAFAAAIYFNPIFHTTVYKSSSHTLAALLQQLLRLLIDLLYYCTT